MSKRFAAWFCLQVFAVSSLSLTLVRADEVKNDSSSNQTGGSPTATTSAGANPAGASVSMPESKPQSATDSTASEQPKPDATTSAAPGPTSASDGVQKQPVAPTNQNSPKAEKKPAEVHAKSPAHASAAQAQTSPVASSQRTVLYGRIEQIAAGAGAQFPILLKPMKAKMDPRGLKLQASASDTALRGSVVSSFPFDFSGNWGGNLTVWTMQQSPICWQTDPDEAKWTQAAIRNGLVGGVNFAFGRAPNNKVGLEPARILFAVPIKDTNQQEQLNQLLSGGALGGQAMAPGQSQFMRQFMGSMVSSMTVPMTLNLGNFQTGGMVQGVSGNQLEESVVRNVIRDLAPGVLEQQIVTSEAERIAKTGQLRYGYGESVIRFTKQTSDQLYVQVATVSYTQNRQFRRKIILYGTVRRGQVVNTNPDPMAGLGNMFNMQPGAGGGQIPQIPQLPGMQPGQNPFENLFPH